MTDFTDFAENELLDHILSVAPYPSPLNVFLSLHTTPTDDAGGGTEVVGNGYGREQIPFAPAVAGVSTSSVLRTFTASGGAWGLISHCALWDSQTGGTMLFHTQLNSSVSVNDTDSIEFQPGAITVTFD